jgi:hypothetical protein
MEEYFKQLEKEYAIPLPDNPSNGEMHEWFLKEQEQLKYLVDKYGEISWNIHRFMELCRAEEISESFFRQVVRKEIDKFIKNESRNIL